VVPAVKDVDPCSELALPALQACSDVTLGGDATTEQWVYVVVTDVDSLQHAGFGILYSHATVRAWHPCVDAFEQADGPWPYAPGTGLQMTLSPASVSTGPLDAVVLGCLVLAEGSWWYMQIAEAWGALPVFVVDSRYGLTPVGGKGLGRIFLDSEEAGHTGCTDLVPVAERTWSRIKSIYRP
jgi:hypothetical protein